MLRYLILTLALVLPSMASAQTCWFFNSDGWGSQVVPPTSSTGQINVWSYFDSCEECPAWSNDRFYLRIWSPTDRPLEGVPIYVDIRDGHPGENGPLLYRISLENASLPFETYLDFDPIYCPALKETTAYVTVGTDLFPDGEVRGQLIPEPPYPVLKSTWGRVRSTYR